MYRFTRDINKDGRKLFLTRVLTFGPVFLIILIIAATANGSGVITGFSQNCAYCYAPPGFSEDGRFLAYNDNAIKRVDLLTGATSIYPNNSDYGVVMSGNGRFMVYRTTDLSQIPEDNNLSEDLVIVDADTGSLSIISADADGNPADGWSHNPSISYDGRLVAFSSYATNLVPGFVPTYHYYAASDVYSPNGNAYLKDTQTDEVTLVSTDSSGSVGNGSSGSEMISADGRYVLFSSNSSELVPGDSNGTYDLFIKDIVTGSTTLVSTDSDGNQWNAGNDSWQSGSISADGRYVAFTTDATNLVPGDINGQTDVFLKDTLTGTTTLVSANSAGVQGNNPSRGESISFDGRYVAFTSSASNLVPDDHNGLGSWFGFDVFVKDTQTGGIERMTVNAQGVEADFPDAYGHYLPTISGNGAYVGFYSDASNLVPPGFGPGPNHMYVAATSACSDAVATPPDLSISGVYWADMADYTAGALSVDFNVDSFFDVYYQVDVVGAVNTNVVTTLSGAPQYMGNIFMGSTSPLTVKYDVPPGVGTFKTTIYASVVDQCGNSQNFPQAYPGS